MNEPLAQRLRLKRRLTLDDCHRPRAELVILQRDDKRLPHLRMLAQHALDRLRLNAFPTAEKKIIQPSGHQ